MRGGDDQDRTGDGESARGGGLYSRAAAARFWALVEREVHQALEVAPPEAQLAREVRADLRAQLLRVAREDDARAVRRREPPDARGERLGLGRGRGLVDEDVFVVLENGLDSLRGTQDKTVSTRHDVNS